MAFASQRASECSCGRLRQHSVRPRSIRRAQYGAVAGAPNPPDGAAPRWFHDGAGEAPRRWRAK